MAAAVSASTTTPGADALRARASQESEENGPAAPAAAEASSSAESQKTSFAAPPAVAITPCDPWPRPYYLEEGLRKVRPYHFTYNTSCKERWRGRGILDVFTTEFRDRPAAYYRDAIVEGRVQVNGRRVGVEQAVRNGDVITHTTHRHEPPVSAQPIRVVHEDDDLVVIDKPAGVPVHPAGRYMYNCVVEIMAAEQAARNAEGVRAGGKGGAAWKPLPCNRLDRLTSGIMFIGKHPKAAERMSRAIKDHAVRKEYVARVIGEFPPGDVVCEQPIMQISPKLGLNRARASGKSALTVFRRLAYYPPTPRGDGPEGKGEGKGEGEGKGKGEDEAEAKVTTEEEAEEAAAAAAATAEGKPWKAKRGYSIVRCLPLTGRTHQLRVHLQFLGHPIANDPIYCNQRVFGPLLGAGDDRPDRDGDIVARLARMGKTEAAEALAYHDEMLGDYERRKAEKMTGALCDVCDTPLYSDPGPHELGIYLHARRYSAADGAWSYETDLPAWALPPDGVAGPTQTTDETAPDELAAKVASMGLDDQGAIPKGVSVDGQKAHISINDSLWVMPGG